MAEAPKVDLTYKPKTIYMPCGDGRFGEAFDSAASSHGVISGQAPPNRLAIPGPAVSITSEITGTVVLGYIGAFIKFFGSDRLALYEHYPCGMMKENVPGYAEADEDGKIKLHIRKIKAAGEIVRQTFPNLKFEPHLLGPEHEVDIKKFLYRI